MYSDLRAMELPAFELDCRDWLVSTPEDGSAPEDIGGAPVVAVLSTAVIGEDDLSPASVVLTVGLLDDGVAEPGRLADVDAKLLDIDLEHGSVSYVMAAPAGQLALLAEFSSDRADPELLARFEELMASFRWAA